MLFFLSRNFWALWVATYLVYTICIIEHFGRHRSYFPHFRKLGTLLVPLQAALGFAEPADDDVRGLLLVRAVEVEVEPRFRGHRRLGRNHPAGTLLASTILYEC